MHEPPVHLEALVARLSLEEKVALLTGQDTWSLRPVPSIGLRSIVMADGPAGVRGTTWDERQPSVNFPSPTAVAASWDRTLVRAIGGGLGSEARRKGVDVLLAPTVNLQRTPFGGRHFEAFSEDPELTSELATHLVRGVQEHGVAATVKHYVANDSETDRFTVDVEVGERVLRELYLRAFEGPVVDGPAWAVMSAYNSINGATASENTPAHQSPPGRMGVRRRGGQRLDGGALDASQHVIRRISPCRGHTAPGANDWSRRCGAARSRKQRSTGRSIGCFAWRRGSERSTGSRPSARRSRSPRTSSRRWPARPRATAWSCSGPMAHCHSRTRPASRSSARRRGSRGRRAAVAPP